MIPSIRQKRFAITAAAMALSGCAIVTVNSFMVRGADLSRYRTYQWASVEALSTGDPRLDNNRFFDERVRAAVDRELGTKSLEKASTDGVDLVVRYHASVTQEIDVRGINEEYKYCEEDDCGPYLYEAGTLIVDLVDARTRDLVWRGWADVGFDGVIDSQDAMEAKVDDTVKRILRRLPEAF